MSRVSRKQTQQPALLCKVGIVVKTDIKTLRRVRALQKILKLMAWNTQTVTK